MTEAIIDIKQIMKMIPHRYPLLLVDRILEIELDKSIVGLKNVTMNEQFFQGHFPDEPVMPGVLIIESMAQTAAILTVKTLGEDVTDKLVYFMSIDGAKFRRKVVPGDSVHMHVKKDRHRGPVWRFKAEAFVDGQLCAEATITAMIADKQA